MPLRSPASCLRRLNRQALRLGSEEIRSDPTQAAGCAASIVNLDRPGGCRRTFQLIEAHTATLFPFDQKLALIPLVDDDDAERV